MEVNKSWVTASGSQSTIEESKKSLPYEFNAREIAKKEDVSKKVSEDVIQTRSNSENRNRPVVHTEQRAKLALVFAGTTSNEKEIDFRGYGLDSIEECCTSHCGNIMRVKSDGEYHLFIHDGKMWQHLPDIDLDAVPDDLVHVLKYDAERKRLCLLDFEMTEETLQVYKKLEKKYRYRQGLGLELDCKRGVVIDIKNNKSYHLLSLDSKYRVENITGYSFSDDGLCLFVRNSRGISVFFHYSLISHGLELGWYPCSGKKFLGNQRLKSGVATLFLSDIDEGHSVYKTGTSRSLLYIVIDTIHHRFFVNYMGERDIGHLNAYICLLKLLLENGADINKEYYNQKTSTPYPHEIIDSNDLIKCSQSCLKEPFYCLYEEMENPFLYVLELCASRVESKRQDYFQQLLQISFEYDARLPDVPRDNNGRIDVKDYGKFHVIYCDAINLAGYCCELPQHFVDAVFRSCYISKRQIRASVFHRSFYLQRLIDYGYPIDTLHDPHDLPLLYDFCLNGRYEKVEVALKAGANMYNVKFCPLLSCLGISFERQAEIKCEEVEAEIRAMHESGRLGEVGDIEKTIQQAQIESQEDQSLPKRCVELLFDYGFDPQKQATLSKAVDKKFWAYCLDNEFFNDETSSSIAVRARIIEFFSLKGFAQEAIKRVTGYDRGKYDRALSLAYEDAHAIEKLKAPLISALPN